jgi:hypothetical protein
MTDHKTMEATWAETLPDSDGESRLWAIGKPADWRVKNGPKVTRITIQQDLPGLHCNLRRVCIWSDETLVAEAPLHNLQAVGYALPVQP